MSLFETIVPLFLIIAAGFITVRSRYVPAEHILPVGDLVLRVALPALIFQTLTNLPLDQALRPAFIAGYALGSLALFGLGLALFVRAFRMTVAQAALVAVGMACSNSGFIGYPLAMGLIGSQAATFLAQCMIVENLLIIPLAVVLGSTDPSRGATLPGVLRATLHGIARNPLVVALLAAVSVAATGLPVPGPLSVALDMLARVSAPVALFVVGGTLASLRLGGLWRPAAVVIAAKLVGHPILVGLALWLVGAPPALIAGGVLFAGIPMLSIYPLLGARAGLSPLAASALFGAVVASFATLAVLTRLMGL